MRSGVLVIVGGLDGVTRGTTLKTKKGDET